MDINTILKAWKKHEYHPVYWLEGEETYFIDLISDAAEKNILSPEEAAFNLIIHYGKETTPSQLINSCMRYPMFAEKQVVILKEAQQMKDLEKLEPYIMKSMPSTILVVAHKEKKVDGRSKLAKALKEHAVLFTANKIKDNELTGWVDQYLQNKGYQAGHKAMMLITDHIGNDLGRIVNELDKLFIHLGSRKNINEDDIEECIGISKQYNLFEFQSAIGKKNFLKSYQIVQYFEHNPKAAPIQMILPFLYSYFSKVYMLMSARGDDKSVAAQTGINAWFMKEYRHTATVYGQEGITSALLLLHDYNLKSIGVDDAGNNDASLLKELLSKLMLFN
ncbi:MAG: DNA polymerase III subunit delta [Bacteroidota bacterium]